MSKCGNMPNTEVFISKILKEIKDYKIIKLKAIYMITITADYVNNHVLKASQNFNK